MSDFLNAWGRRYRYFMVCDADSVMRGLHKYSSSLLVSPFIQHEHYAIPQLSPDDIVGNWAYRNIGIFIDLGRVRDEFAYYAKCGSLQPQTQRELICQPTYYELMDILQKFREPKLGYLSNDIETIRSRGKGSAFVNHPGFPYTNSFADSPFFGVSYSFWDYEPWQSVNIMRETDYLLHQRSTDRAELF